MTASQSSRTLVAVILLVAALFIAIRHSITAARLADWWSPLVLFVVGVGFALAARAGQRPEPRPAPSQPRPEPVEVARPAQPDDLRRIEGIGPKIATALSAAGIDTYDKLANASEDELRAALEAAGIRFAPSLPTWSEQARYAARGDWDGLATLQSTLVAGRRE
jgi:predicted flap endonuclease-1-like 5' DNA nuclease